MFCVFNWMRVKFCFNCVYVYIIVLFIVFEYGFDVVSCNGFFKVEGVVKVFIRIWCWVSRWDLICILVIIKLL